MPTASAVNSMLPPTSSATSEELVEAVEHGAARLTRSRSRIESSDVPWIQFFLRCDQILGGGLLHLCYRIIDVIILCTGLSQARATCRVSNNLTSTTFCLLIFYFIDFLIIGINFFRCLLPSQSTLSEEEKTERSRRVANLRGFFVFFKLVPVFFGAGYVLFPSVPFNQECQLIRFCLGVVCLSTILAMIMPSTKPIIPQRRSFRTECFIVSFVLLVNGAYLTSTALSMRNVQQATCIYESSEDLYSGAPLKSYASVGLVIFSCTTALHIINGLVSQLCNRLRNGRRLYTSYYAVQYTLNYLASLVVVYYLSVGALLLFPPRAGLPCRADAPGLFRTLLAWEWIRVLTPLVAVPLVLIVCCVGVFFGFVLSYCLPASVTVPLIDVIRNWLSAAPVSLNRDPPVTQSGIDAIPMVLFGQEPDQFNQTECAICQASFEANESIKKLECAHLFHAECVANWLSITGICPVCRHRMTLTH